MDVRKVLEQEEGFRKTAYYCTEGYPTIGIGWKIGSKGQPLEDFSCMVIDRDTARTQMIKSVQSIAESIDNRMPEFSLLNEARKSVLISMAYQMGVTGLFQFKNMIKAIVDGDFDKAYGEGLDSRWAKQTPDRAVRHMNTLRSGDWSEYQ